MKLKCIIVDDEALALDILENYIERIDSLQLVARCANAVEAFNILQQQAIDLMFLDIQMPKLTGIDFLKTVSHPPKVIFTTAYRDYALESYEMNAVDYLLKPISFDRFLKAVNKVQELFQEAGAALRPLPTAPAADSSYDESFIYLKADKKMVKIFLKDILFIESLKDYIRVRTEQKEVISYQKISYMEEKLPEQKFLRIHRSFIVAVDKIESFSAAFVEVGGKEVPIGRNYKNEVLKMLEQNNLLEE
ncbi:LytR/AlgR family response regulator transcription factor [Eisenibacter elegans]|jgi:DNA-binding LytR/AlgR family response regulator|uniref:LytR/AlgR family response regulator transcription factor n=1 Tax=Eisenibacter elegans TaxID=997 RepID=UPI0004069783|nr:LytTR family DNA-binding domain-containing protein [Eisenibacter elegans]